MTPEKPAPAQPDNGLKTVEGQITFIDAAAHKITVKDSKGASTTFVWPGPLHEKFSRLQAWWFTRITGEYLKDDDIWKAISQDYFKRPDDWPASQHTGGGGRSYVPRNEKPMAYESAFKSCADLVRDTDFPGLTYEQRVAAVVAEADKVAKWIVTEGGA